MKTKSQLTSLFKKEDITLKSLINKNSFVPITGFEVETKHNNDIRVLITIYHDQIVQE